jgi:hypothetical protein
VPISIFDVANVRFRNQLSSYTLSTKVFNNSFSVNRATAQEQIDAQNQVLDSTSRPNLPTSAGGLWLPGSNAYQAIATQFKMSGDGLRFMSLSHTTDIVWFMATSKTMDLVVCLT